MSLECLCVKNVGGIGRATGGILRAKISCSPANVKVSMKGVGSISPAASRTRGVSSKLVATGKLSSPLPAWIKFCSNAGKWCWPKCPDDDTGNGDDTGSGDDPGTGDDTGNGDDNGGAPPPILSFPPQQQFWAGSNSDDNTCFGRYDYLSLSVEYGVKQRLTGVFEINPGLSLTLNPHPHFRAVGDLTSSYTDKFAGSFNDFGCYQKLYPIKDVIVGSDGNYFVDRTNGSGTLYDNIDEGVFTGSYHTQHGVSHRIADDIGTFIQPSAIYTEGTFRYKCEVTNPRVTGKDSRLYFRASAPTTNYSSHISPEYKIYDIKLEDPSGNLIIQYNDITMRGDANYENTSDPTYVNFSTYGTDPKTNNWNLYTWEDDYPVMQTGSGYTLDFYVDVTCLDDPFDPGFDTGYEDTCQLYVSDAGNDDYLAVDGAPLSTQTQNLSLNPTNTIRISAIEICNSGGYNTVYDRYVPMYVDVEPTGRRIERCLLPTAMPLYEFDAGIYPTVSSIWSDQNSYTNQSGVGAGILTSQLRNDVSWSYITMDETSPIPDSGKLFVKFSHEKPGMVWALRDGAFSFGIPGSGKPETIGDFDTATKSAYTPVDHFFTIDSLSLKVKAKKAVGSRDYALDVVGWSDDRLLNITPAIGGFLQNTSGVGDKFIPEASGYGTTDYQALAGEPVSDQDQYYESSGTNNAGGDHYLLSSIPMVTGTLFGWYEIPLKIYEDTAELGKSTDYSISSYFENLYMDIFPLPSGATIASLQLCISYKPTNAFNLYTVGGDNIERIKNIRGEGKLFPSPKQDMALKPYLHSLEYPQRGSADGIQADSGPAFSPLSKIENIPHAYRSPTDAKSNYARRWRGMEGTVKGPFDPDMFGFGFENPLLDFPFVSGYYDFSYDNGLDIISRPLGDGFGSLTGTLSTTYTDHHFNNLAWRFNTSGIFDDQLPDLTGLYRTTDWTSLSKPGFDFTGHELYGKIADAFSNAVRTSGQNSYITFGDVDITDQFSMYVRFTPDANVSGADYNLFDSGVVFSKWNAGSNLEFALGYDGGYLCAFAEASDGTLMTAKDTLAYSGYQYPLSVVMTHHNASGLRLYTDNELHVDGYGDTVLAPFDTFRASSIPFTLRTGSSDLLVGHSPGSGVGMNMFVSEFGISNAANLVDVSGSRERTTSPDLTFKEVTANKFLENNRAKYWQRADENIDRYKLWSYVDEDTQDWDLGAFKYCEFSAAFDWFTKRVGKDLISFNMKHDGSGYIQRIDLQLPSSINYENIAYHTQIENDFLRLNLSDAAHNFHSVTPRITKDLPRGYKFSDRALVVETVLEHDTYNELEWPDGSKGPKLIVSLYTQNKDPYWDAEQPNWGLVNRDIHYLEASGCWRRIDSTFDYDNMFDESEPWALFPTGDRRFTEFGHKYYSQDINEMFLQYDLVYPSGPPFESRINIHSAHVRLEDAFVVQTSTSGELHLTVSGQKEDRETLNLHTAANCIITNLDSGHQYCSGIRKWDIALGEYPSGLSLYMLPRTSGRVDLDGSNPYLSGLPLFISGSPYKSEQLNLYTATWSGVDSAWNPPGMSLYTSGNYRVDNLDHPFSLVLANSEEWGPVPSSLNLNMHASNRAGNFAYLPILLYNNVYSRDKGSLNNLTPSGLAMLTLGRNALASDYAYGAMNLVTLAPRVVNADLNLVVWVDTSFTTDLGDNASLNLHTANYSSVGGAGSPYMHWSNTNYGHPIDSDDNVYTSVSADNEIRGVDLICFGSCDTTGNVKCNEKALDTHCVIWNPDNCIDGGIFRALRTYTNLTASGFGDTVGYSGNYYGVRKYTGLMPGMAYNLTVQGQTGKTESINLPREWEEWEYGICGPDVAGCCDDDCGQNLGFSGVKMVGDYPYFGGDKSLSIPSGRMENDQFGRDVAVKGNLMVVGSPHHELDEKGGSTYLASGTTANAHLAWEGGSGLDNAGALFVYRRRDPLNGGYKAPWDFEEKVVLPSAFRADYFHDSPGSVSFGGLPAIPVRKWNVGQEGRELGWSVDAAIDTSKTSLYNTQREVIVAGAPGARWNRQFDNILTSGVQIGVMVFSDEFTYTGKDGKSLRATIDEQNMIYRYYSSPLNPAEVEAGAKPIVVELDLKVIVCQPTGIFGNSSSENFDLADFVFHKKIGRKYGLSDNEIFGQIKEVFLEAFPFDDTQINSGIPPMVGVYIDDSRSLGRSDLEPAIDLFKDYYSQYSLLSGVKDFYGAISTGHMFEYYGDGPAEKWLDMSQLLIKKLLDTGRLMTIPPNPPDIRFITSGVGLEFANTELTEFNLPPASGGRVYVFEKEKGNWNLIQEIKSPEEGITDFGGWSATGVDSEDSEIDDLTTIYSPVKENDRYGHAVAISDDTEVITVGSPYINEACQVYAYDATERNRLYANVQGWLQYKNEYGKYDSEIGRFLEYARQYGTLIAAEMIYTDLSASEKFDMRSDEGYWDNDIISEYRKIYTYSYSNVGRLGTWQFIPNRFAPTSRLGYSTTVNEDGTMAAFGAPTDSFNKFEDSNVYYEPYDTWSSYVNAGAVRIFESREYHPHSGVVEFNKFGNLGRSSDPDHPEYYQDLKHIFEVGESGLDDSGDNVILGNIPFNVTQFADLEVPKDAGTAFVISPEIDSASDEVMENIRDWLALGDRTLVLVGNDPVWEDDGRYEESNKIINKILDKLGSRMRLHPARNKYESLPECAEEHRPNIISSFKPAGSRSTDVYMPTMYGKGVADIRIHMPGYGTEQSPCDAYQARCEMWLRDQGDLRAEWQKCCCKKVGGKAVCKIEPVNWPVRFGTHTTLCEGGQRINSGISIEYSNGTYTKTGGEPLPLLVAAEWISGYTVQQPDSSGQKYVELYAPKTLWVPPKDPVTTYNFADEHIDNVEFIWSADSGNYTSLAYHDSPSASNGMFFDPDPFEDMDQDGNAVVRDGVLQGGPSELVGVEKAVEQVEVYPNSIVVAEESWPSKSTSRVVMIGAVTPESEGALTQKLDYNVSFYENLVRTSCTEKGRIYQLGGWTNRTSFKDAYAESLLQELFFFKGNTVVENFDSSEHDLSDNYNVCWIAAPAGQPTDDELAPLKDWMDKGNKTLVITYPNRIIKELEGSIFELNEWTPPDQTIARNVEVICGKLGINMKPIYLSGKQRYAHRDWDTPPEPQKELQLKLSDAHDIITGCNNKEKVNAFTMEDIERQYDGDSRVSHFIPIDLGGVASKVIWTCYKGLVVLDEDEEVISDCKGEAIYDDRFVGGIDPKTSFWQMKSNIAKLSVPVIPYSGYRVFFNWASETPDEDAELKVWLNNSKDCAGKVGGNTCGSAELIGSSTGILDEPAHRIPSTYSGGDGDGWLIEDYIWATEPGEADKKFEHARAHLKVNPLKRNGIQNNTQWGYVDIQALNFKSSASEVGSGVDIYFSSVSNSGESFELQPEANYSIRLLSVSGVFLPINEVVRISKGEYICDPALKMEDATCVSEQGKCAPCSIGSIPSGEFIISPGSERDIPEHIRPIKTDNTQHCSCDTTKPIGPCGDGDCSCKTVSGPNCGDKYGCEGLGGKLIDDGPVVAAEEYELFSSFPAGHKRSRIVLISDSNIVQGDCSFYRSQTVPVLGTRSPNRDFIRSLYPETFDYSTDSSIIGGSQDLQTTTLPDGTVLQNRFGGRQFGFIEKMLAPERGSPQKYYAASGLSNLINRFDDGRSFSPASNPCGTMVHSASTNDYHPDTVHRPKDPKTEEQIKSEIKKFNNEVIPAHGGISLFSGIMEGTMYKDATVGGAIPQLMKDKGYDYIDFDRFPSGYPGDLFGFSLSMHSGQLMVGAPFNGFTGEEVVHWKDDAACLGSGLKLSGNGGAGAVYYFERTERGSGLYGLYRPWEFLEKIKPSSINAGYDSTDTTISQLEENLGTNNYTSSDLVNDGFVTDMFGYDVSVQCDFVAIGAPGHDFENYHEHIYDRVENGVPYSGAFLRKSFDFQFDIPLHNVYDLGGSGTRDALDGSGTSVLNNGAVFTYQHRIDDWQERTKKWSFAEKLIPQGYNSRKQKEYSMDMTPLPISGAENDHFGKSIDINRARRTDGDYTLAVGAPHHMFATSGNHDSDQPLLQAGASYVYDAMIRSQPPALGSPDNWIMADVYGQLNKADKIRLTIQQNADGAPITYTQTGQVVSNNDGEIFLEASGYDPVIRGFTEHRSYIQLVYGDVVHGTPDSDYFNLYTSGRVPIASSIMNLHTLAPDSAYVYNSMDLYAPSVLGIASGVPSGLYLYLDCPSGIAVSGGPLYPSSGLWLYTSGSATPSEQINLSMRGK